MRPLVGLGLIVSALSLGACDLAPPYRVPSLELPHTFKESRTWQRAEPADRQPRGVWWSAFKDHALASLEAQVDVANPTLAVAFANDQQARAAVQRAQASLYPTIGFAGDLSTNRQSDHRPLRSPDQPSTYGDNEVALQSAYEVDLWGRVKDSIAASAADAQAQAALLESVRLSLHADVARDYVALRGLDRELALLQTTRKAYQDALALTQNRLAGKIASPIDVARAQAQLESTKALIEDTSARRAVLEHALASLSGVPASSYSLPRSASALRVPRGPSAAPSTLLERRPDVAAAEREVAAANEAIGGAKAAFYPRFFLNLSGGTQDTGLHLLDLNNALFTLGPSVTLPIFDGGRRDADLRATTARRDASEAHYRATVLQAVQEVEDALAEGRDLERETRRIEAAVTSQKKVLDLSLTLYRDGATNYLDVVTAQTSLLAGQRTLLAVRTRQLTASINLFVALGGDWKLGTNDKDPVAGPHLTAAAFPVLKPFL